MTNLEKIKTKIKHPSLEDTDYESALEDRGLTPTDEYSDSNLKAMELTRADMLLIMVTLPDISESNFKVSQSQKDLWIKQASGIYHKWGVADPNKEHATGRFISPW